MRLLATFNPEKVTAEESAAYTTREAARAVVFDAEGKIGLLDVSKWHYHKLPGGGFEEGEDAVSALRRECREEIGCEIEIVAYLGEVVEYRKTFGVKQSSYCYLAKLSGTKGVPSFMPDEIEAGFRVVWVEPDAALAMLCADKPGEKQGELYIVPRDRLVIEAAMELIRASK